MTHAIIALCAAVAIGYCFGRLHEAAIWVPKVPDLCSALAKVAAGKALASSTVVYRACEAHPDGEVCRRRFSHSTN